MQIEKIERGSTRGQLDVSYGLGKYLDFFVYGTGAVDGRRYSRENILPKPIESVYGSLPFMWQGLWQ